MLDYSGQCNIGMHEVDHKTSGPASNLVYISSWMPDTSVCSCVKCANSANLNVHEPGSLI